MKTCYYQIDEDGRFGWYLAEWTDTPACKCIMSVVEGETIQLDALNRMRDNGMITDKELHAIYAFDGIHGKDYDFEIIKKIADRFKVELMQK